MARPRAADDFEAIRMRMNELRRVREQVSTSDEKLRTDRQQARSDGWLDPRRLALVASAAVRIAIRLRRSVLPRRSPDYRRSVLHSDRRSRSERSTAD